VLYSGVALALAVIAVVALLFALRLLIGTWLLGWLRGTAGIVLTVIAVAIAAGAWNLRSYQELLATKPIGTLAFNKLEDQRFSVTLIDASGAEQRYELSGDMWQLDVRVLRWTDTLARLGFKPGYRLDRLSGRYLALEDEQKLPRTVIGLNNDKPLLDVWSWLRRCSRYFSLLTADYGSAAYLPMADGALYSVGIGNSGLIATPLNERAKLAIEHWQ
jgi:hypothetical protein